MVTRATVRCDVWIWHKWQIQHKSFLALWWPYTLITSIDLVSLELTTSCPQPIRLQYSESDSLTWFHPLGLELAAFPWPVLSNHMRSASISSCQMVSASAEAGIQSPRSSQCVLSPFTYITALSHWPRSQYSNIVPWQRRGLTLISTAATTSHRRSVSRVFALCHCRRKVWTPPRFHDWRHNGLF